MIRVNVRYQDVADPFRLDTGCFEPVEIRRAEAVEVLQRTRLVVTYSSIDENCRIGSTHHPAVHAGNDAPPLVGWMNRRKILFVSRG